MGEKAGEQLVDVIFYDGEGNMRFESLCVTEWQLLEGGFVEMQCSDGTSHMANMAHFHTMSVLPHPE